MPQLFRCEYCGHPIPRSAASCPHCGRPGLFPNVRDSKDPEEVAALGRRYRTAKARARAKSRLEDFEDKSKNSDAVIARSLNEAQRLATSDNEIYATYYQLIGGGVRSHTGDKWSILRALADDALFPGYKENIRFACLTLSGAGLSNYGECSLVMREDMIAHRSSAVEENSTMFMLRHKIKVSESYNLPRGYRAPWEERHKLCVAKLHRMIKADTPPDKYSEILLAQGTTTAEDNFVEIHIWGALTVRAVKQVTITERPKYGQRAIINALKERLNKMGVGLVVR
jgi:hypothetical protein